MKEIIPQNAWKFYENVISPEAVDQVEHVDGLNASDAAFQEEMFEFWK